MRKIRKFTVIMLILALLLGTVPAMAADEGNLSIFDGLGKEINGLATDKIETKEPTGDLIALDDLNISVRASDYVAVRQDEDEAVYIYTYKDGYIPYVLIANYDTEFDGFVDKFTKYMASNYKDLTVAQEATPLTLGGGKEFSLVVYNYKISGYDAIDIRLFREFNNDVYMFCTKAIPELGMSLPNGYIENVAGSMEILAGGDGDYPLHVDSERSIEPSLSVPDVSLEDTDSKKTSPVGDSETPVESVGDAESDYDGVVVFDASQADYDGTWVEFEDGFKLYLPSDWVQYGLSDSQMEAGILYAAYDPSTTRIQMMVQVSACIDNTVHSIDDMKRVMDTSADIDAEDTMLINGIPCATYSTNGGTLSGIMFFHPTLGAPYVFLICVGDYTVDKDLCEEILCSLSLAG